MDSTETTTEIDIEQLVRGLDVDFDIFPEAALRVAQSRAPQIIPRLIEATRQATRQQAVGVALQGNLPIFALYLLAEFKACDALPAILEAISLPGDGPLDLYGDAIHEDLDRILAVLAAGQTELVYALIDCPNVNKYVRASVLGTYGYWVRDGIIPRDVAGKALKAHLRLAIDQGEIECISFFVGKLVDMGASEARDEVVEAYDRGLVDEWVIDRKSALADLQDALEMSGNLTSLRPYPIIDTVEELRHWGCFLPKPVRSPERPPVPKPMAPPPSAPSRITDAEDPGWQSPDQVRRESAASRNAPCPCGSGKKYKKCCGSPAGRR